MSAPPFLLPCPPTPIMLYVGAGYDLSPLLTFAPDGPPYPIVPLAKQGHADSSLALPGEHARYTSFLFVDAKPRHTSAYMVPDFHEWTTIESRVRNVLHYSQGSLSRWRTVPGAPDLLWFEGGGDAALVESRSREPAWVFPVPDPSDTCLFFPQRSAHRASLPTPLTTLLYLFNTLDVELVRAPLLENVWPCVEALYVHGLRLHVRTGAGLDLGRHHVPNGRMAGGTDACDSGPGVDGSAVLDLYGPSLPTQLGTGLKRCFVIVGSWGTPLRKRSSTRHKDRRPHSVGRDERGPASTGVRHVDFVREAWKRWKVEAQMCPELEGGNRQLNGPGLRLPLSVSPSTISSSSPLPSTPSSGSLPGLTIREPLCSQAYVAPSSPMIFRRARVRHSVPTHQDWPLDNGWESDCEGPSAACTDWIESDYDDEGGDDLQESIFSSSLRTAGPFHMRIPQVAWSSALRGGRGGYYVEKTVEESVAVWRARKGKNSAESEGDESASEGEFDYEAHRTRDKIVGKKKSVRYLYSLRSFFGIRASTPPSLSTPTHPVGHTPIISRSRTTPPRSRPRLRPRHPTPAPGSKITESENSTSEAEFEVDRDHMDDVWRCECQRRGESRMKRDTASEKESLSFGFLRRALLARCGVDDLSSSVGVQDMRGMSRTRERSKSMSHIDRNIPDLQGPATVLLTDNKAGRTTTHGGVSRHSRNTASKSLDIPSHSANPSLASSSHSKPRERRIDIADFLSTTSDPNACDTDEILSSNDVCIPTSISDSGPFMLSSGTPRDSLTLNSAGATISSFYRSPATSTSWSFSSPSISPGCLPTTFHRSPYGPSIIFDNDDDNEQTCRGRSPKRRTLMFPFWTSKMKQQRVKKYRESTYISRVGSISGFFKWKMPMARDRDASPPSSGVSSSPTSARTSFVISSSQSTGCTHNHTPCVRAHSPGRTHSRTTHCFRSAPDAPPVPPLPSHFRRHNHTRSLYEPIQRRRGADSIGPPTRPYARAASSNVLSASILPVATGDTNLNRSISSGAQER